MLIAGTLKKSTATKVSAAARRMETVRRQLPQSLRESEQFPTTLFDRREIPDRTIDVIVDRLLKELTW